MKAHGRAGYLLLEVALVPIRMLRYLHSSRVPEAAAASEQVKGLGRIRKMVMKKERLGEGGLSHPSLFLLHCTEPQVKARGAVSPISVQHPLTVPHEAVLCVS